MHEVRGTWFLAGLHSFGDACQGPARPAVFAALPTYENWVSSLDWQVYFAKEPEPEPKPEPEPESCAANMSTWPWGLLPTPASADPFSAGLGPSVPSQPAAAGGAMDGAMGIQVLALVIDWLGAHLLTCAALTFQICHRGLGHLLPLPLREGGKL